MEFLSRFEYTLLYIKGDKNVCADALSRLLDLREHIFELPGKLWPHSRADANSECRRVSRRLEHPHEQLSTADRGGSADSAVGAQHSFTIQEAARKAREEERARQQAEREQERARKQAEKEQARRFPLCASIWTTWRLCTPSPAPSHCHRRQQH